jgi:HSP20 family protein
MAHRLIAIKPTSAVFDKLRQHSLVRDKQKRRLAMSLQNLHDMPSEIAGTMFFQPFQKELWRLMEQFRNGFPMPDMQMAPVFGGAGFPAIDVVEQEDAVAVSAEVPGVSEADLDVSISGAMLILKGEKTAGHEDTWDNLRVVERRYGSFGRQIPLGFAPEDGATEAHFADGVLKLRIARPAAAKVGVQTISISRT